MYDYEPLPHVLNKKELQRYENDPNWKNARRTIFILFWTLLIIMVISAIVITLKAENYMCRLQNDRI